MKKFSLSLLILLSSCIDPNIPSAINGKSINTAIIQTCIDSLYREYLVNMDQTYPYHITKVVLNKSKHFNGDQKFNWGKYPITYKFVPDSLMDKPYVYDTFSNIEMQYMLKADSITVGDNKAYAKILMTGVGSQAEFYLSYKNDHWIIEKTLEVDYKLTPGPNIIRDTDNHKKKPR